MNERIKENYITCIFMVEKINKLFLESINTRFTGAHDINNTQCILLYKIGVNKNPIIKQHKLSYGGENHTYNLQAMEKNGYIICDVLAADKRMRTIKLSPKGQELFEKMNDYFNNNIIFLMKEKNWTEEKLNNFLYELSDLEDAWVKKDMTNIVYAPSTLRGI